MPSILCAGFAALDQIRDLEDRNPRDHFAGGTAANVAALLAWRGWQSTLISSIATDKAGEVLIQDLQNWGVDTELVYTNNYRTPIWTQTFGRRGPVLPEQKASFKCPDCGNSSSVKFQLPRNVPRDFFTKIHRSPKPDFFFFDRVTPEILEIAEKLRKLGTRIWYEPNTSTPNDDGVRVADYVKFSSQRIKTFSDTVKQALIVTNGQKSIKYRFRGWNDVPTEWLTAATVRSEKDLAVDPTGCGDNFTASAVDSIAQITAGVNLDDFWAATIRWAAWDALACLESHGSRGHTYNDKTYGKAEVKPIQAGTVCAQCLANGFKYKQLSIG